jgi:hypothetical protein
VDDDAGPAPFAEPFEQRAARFMTAWTVHRQARGVALGDHDLMHWIEQWKQRPARKLAQHQQLFAEELDIIVLALHGPSRGA